MKAVIYTRISRLDEEDMDDPQRATKRQEDDCRALCQARGWEVIDVYSDEDLSGFKDVVRDDYEKLKGDIAAGRFSEGEWVVVSDAMTRVGRNRNEIEDFIIHDLDDNGIKYASAKDPDMDTTTATGRLVLRILALLAQFESELMGERIARRRRSDAESGKPSPGGRRAFGYEADGVTVIKAEAKLIKEAADRYIGGESANSIARDWVKREVTTPDGNEWRGSHILRFLRSDRVVGKRTYNGDKKKRYDAKWDAILKLEEQRDIIRRGSGKRGPKGERWMLTGVLRCAECGTGMNSWNHAQGRRYRCVSGPGNPGCGRVSVAAEPVERLIWNAALGYTWDAEQVDAEAVDKRLKQVRTELARTLDRRDKLDAAYWQANDVDEGTYRSQYGALSDKMHSLEVEAEQLKQQRSDIDEWTSAIRLAQHYETASEAHRKAVVGRALNAVRVTPAQRGKWFDAGRLTLEWRDGSTTIGTDHPVAEE